MSWTARQQALLRAMGLPVWSAPVDVPTNLPAPVAGAGRSVVPRRPPDSQAVPAREVVPATVAVAGTSVSVAQTPAALAAALPPPAFASPVRVGGTAASKLIVRGDVAALDWQPLRQAVASCTACGLCQSRKQAVFGSGAAQAHWLVVGEPPSEPEDLQGLPFVGPPGELLDHMLQALQLTRAEGGGDAPPSQRVFIVNTVKCRPPKNRNPTAEELAACEPFLLRQIELLQPRIILALGVFAIKALLRSDEPVGKLRGRVHHYQGVPVVVSYHPNYLLRQPLEKARAWEDLCLAADTAEAAPS